MKFVSIPQLPTTDTTAVAAGQAGRITLDQTSNRVNYDTGAAWV